MRILSFLMTSQYDSPSSSRFCPPLNAFLCPVTQAVTTVTKRGVVEVKNSTGDSLGHISENFLSKARLQYESAIDNATTVTFFIQETSILASQVRIIMEVAFTVSPVSSGC